MSLSSSIEVTVRVRPFSIREAAQLIRLDDGPSYFGDGSLAGVSTPKMGKGLRRVVKVVDDRMLVFDPPEDNPMARYQKTILPQGKKVKDMQFGFDKVLDETCSQQDVYESTARPLLDNVLDGYNATVFAYGATGCGKTHTISGSKQQPGIIFLTCAELFAKISALAEEKEVDLTLSYLEIYNETIRDLLVPGGSTNGLSLREDTKQNITVSGLITSKPKNADEVMDLLVQGNANRTQSPTEANATSSRSHAVLQINVIQRPKTAGLQEDHLCSTLSIIDLAGSERASVTKNRGARLLEGANINRSLLALGNCINALCDPAKKNHVPYRDSKLTRLLKFSLGGNCKTVMIVCVSPSSEHYDETHNTLKYANRAKNIKTKISRNMMNVNRHVSQYVKAIYDLRQENEALKKKLEDSTSVAMEKVFKQNLSKEACIKDGLQRLLQAYDQSTEMRKERVNDLKRLRMIERRASLVSAWMAAYDEIMGARETDEATACIAVIQGEASKILEDLEDQKMFTQKRLANSAWERAIESTLQSTLRNLNAIENATESDGAVLIGEAKFLRTRSERDILHSIAESDIDFSNSIQLLTKTHFETIGTINKILHNNITDPGALETARQALEDVSKGASEAIQHIVKPNGELISSETYQPSQYTPRKKYFSSPARPNLVQPSPLPVRFSPRLAHKVKSPRRPVRFPAKKKKVRFEGDDSFDNDASVLDTEMPAPPPRMMSLSGVGQENCPPTDSLGLMAPPQRPKSRFQAGFLAKSKDNSPSIDLDASSTSPLQNAGIADQVLNRGSANTTMDMDTRPSSAGEQRPWSYDPTKLPGKSALRKSKSIAESRRRSPSASSKPSPPEGKGKLGMARRMANRERENGSIRTVLSPRSEGIKGAARRNTIGPANMRLSSLALAGLKDMVPMPAGGTGAQGLSKTPWR